MNNLEDMFKPKPWYEVVVWDIYGKATVIRGSYPIDDGLGNTTVYKIKWELDPKKSVEHAYTYLLWTSADVIISVVRLPDGVEVWRNGFWIPEEEIKEEEIEVGDVVYQRKRGWSGVPMKVLSLREVSTPNGLVKQALCEGTGGFTLEFSGVHSEKYRSYVDYFAVKNLSKIPNNATR